jgi:hypothetical protein
MRQGRDKPSKYLARWRRAGPNGAEWDLVASAPGLWRYGRAKYNRRLRRSRRLEMKPTMSRFPSEPKETADVRDVCDQVLLDGRQRRGGGGDGGGVRGSVMWCVWRGEASPRRQTGDGWERQGRREGRRDGLARERNREGRGREGPPGAVRCGADWYRDG